MARIRVEPPGGEPFFDELQRLQPDIDVVLLPPEPTPDGAPATTPLSPEETGRTADHVLAVTEELLLAADLRPTVRSERWERSSGAGRRFTVRLAVRDLDADGALTALRRLRAQLLERGWDARPVDAPQPRMTATSPDGSVLLEASCSDTAVDVALRSPLLVPDPAVLDSGEGVR